MRFFHIILVDHCVLECGIDALMPKELLNLLDWHSFVNRHCGQSSSEFMRVNLMETQFTANFPQTYLNTANLQPLEWFHGSS